MPTAAESICMAEKRKYEVVLYSAGYKSELFKDWAWAFSKKQALKLIKDRLKAANDHERLYLFRLHDLPMHIVDITARDVKEREVKRNSGPKAKERYETCPKCSGNVEDDYCQQCGWQRFAAAEEGFRAVGVE